MADYGDIEQWLTSQFERDTFKRYVVVEANDDVLYLFAQVATLRSQLSHTGGSMETIIIEKKFEERDLWRIQFPKDGWVAREVEAPSAHVATPLTAAVPGAALVDTAFLQHLFDKGAKLVYSVGVPALPGHDLSDIPEGQLK